MNKFVFKGEDTHLGRFGQVRKGDQLELTDHEATTIQGDKRFEVFVPGKTVVKPPGLKLPDDFDSMTDAEKKNAIAKAESDEKARVDALSQQNQKTEAEELNQMSKDALIAFAKKMKDEGKPVDFKPDATKKQIRAAIRRAIGQAEDEADKGPEEETK